MINITTLRAMAAAGASVEVILAAVEAELMAEGVRVQARRAKDAERQRRRRHVDSDNVAPCHTESRGVTRTPRDENVSFLLSSSSENSTSKKEVRKKERARKTLLPDDWLPNPKHYAKGSRSYIDQKADDMRNWAKSKAIMRADWDATFHGFLRPREGFGGSSNAKASAGDRAREFARRIREVEHPKGVGRPDEFFGGDGDSSGPARPVSQLQKLG